jgi:hypothetical protein
LAWLSFLNLNSSKQLVKNQVSQDQKLGGHYNSDDFSAYAVFGLGASAKRGELVRQPTGFAELATGCRNHATKMIVRYWRKHGSDIDPANTSMQCPSQACKSRIHFDRPKDHLKDNTRKGKCDLPRYLACCAAFWKPFEALLPAHRIRQEALYHFLQHISTTTNGTAWTYKKLRNFSEACSTMKLLVEGSAASHDTLDERIGALVLYTPSTRIASLGEWIALQPVGDEEHTTPITVARVHRPLIRSDVEVWKVFVARRPEQDAHQWHYSKSSGTLTPTGQTSGHQTFRVLALNWWQPADE